MTTIDRIEEVEKRLDTHTARLGEHDKRITALDECIGDLSAVLRRLDKALTAHLANAPVAWGTPLRPPYVGPRTSAAESYNPTATVDYHPLLMQANKTIGEKDALIAELRKEIAEKTATIADLRDIMDGHFDAFYKIRQALP